MTPGDTASSAAIHGDASDDITIAVREAQKNAVRAMNPFKKPPVDVTADFISASKLLEPGQLVKDEDFTLFEAVGALEVSGDDCSSDFRPPV